MYEAPNVPGYLPAGYASRRLCCVGASGAYTPSMRELHIPTWDLPVRLFHWTLLGLVGFSWWSGEQGEMWLKYHFWSGYAILSLVVFRLVWGFCGSYYARFAQFLRGPAAVLASLRELLSPRPMSTLGHNPLGGWMVLALLAVLLVQTLTGLFANDDIMWEGPLYAHVSKDLSDRLTGIHGFNFDILLALVGIHVAAIGWHRWRKGERLVSAMLSGYKPAPADTESRAFVSLWRALVIFVIVALAVAGLIRL